MQKYEIISIVHSLMEEYELIGQGIWGSLLDQDPACIKDISFDVGEGVRLPAFY